MLTQIYAQFLGNLRYELEEFDLHKGRYYQFLKPPGQDLSEEELELMLSGLFHIQDGTDHSGRVIVHIFSHLFGKYKAESVVRMMMYDDAWDYIAVNLS